MTDSSSWKRAPEASETLHVLLTRFNVRSGGKEQVLRQHPKWLRERFELFDRFCFPSVNGQSRKDFTWIVFFDAETPEPFKNRLEHYYKCPQFTPVFVDRWRAEAVKEAIGVHVNDKHRYLLTTRLDNDDALHSEYMARLRDGLEPRVPCFYNFPNGIVYSDGRVFLRRDISNAFASFCEPIEKAATVWSLQHQEIEGSQVMVQLDLPNAWLQVVHGRNVSNRIKGRRTTAAVLSEGYGELTEVIVSDPTWKEWFIERTVLWPARTFREQGIQLVKPLLRSRTKSA